MTILQAVWPIRDLTEFSPRTLNTALAELPVLADEQQATLHGAPTWLLVCLHPAAPRLKESPR